MVTAASRIAAESRARAEQRMRTMLSGAERHAAAVERATAVFGAAGFDVGAVRAHGLRVALQTRYLRSWVGDARCAQGRHSAALSPESMRPPGPFSD